MKNVNATELLTALVIEDSLSERERTKALLTQRGIDAVCVSDLKQGLRRLRRPFYDLVLSDWELPDGSGMELCREVSALPLTIRPYFIMVTGRNQGADLVAAMDAGADDFIRKPLFTEELRVRLNVAAQAIAWRRVVREAGLTAALKVS